MDAGAFRGERVKIDVCFTPAELAGLDAAGSTAVVIDALRATSTITVALANGARAVYPANAIEDAVRLMQNLGRDGALLGGERRCVKPDGFDLGNSPLEYTAERVAGKMIALTTTNGTLALHAVPSAKETFVLSFLNLAAIADALVESEADNVVIVCSGRERRFAIEDAVCAGMLVRTLQDRDIEMDSGDSAVAARVLADRLGTDLETLLLDSAAGRFLVEIGMRDDVVFCAGVDTHPVVPRVRDRQVVLT